MYNNINLFNLIEVAQIFDFRCLKKGKKVLKLSLIICANRFNIQVPTKKFHFIMKIPCLYFYIINIFNLYIIIYG